MVDINDVVTGQKKLTDVYYHLFNELMNAAEGEA